MKKIISLLLVLVLCFGVFVACNDTASVVDKNGESSGCERGHKVVTDAAVVPTCTQPGLTEGKHCSVCGEMLIAQTTIDATGHEESVHSGLCEICGAQMGTYDLDGKVIVNMGDSIFGNYSAPTDISTFLSNQTLATVYNVSFGGCRMAKHTIENFDAFGMYRLAEAIVTRDFSLQDAAIANGKTAQTEAEGRLPVYFEKKNELLKSIDFSKVDILTIAYGTNDFTGYRPIDNVDNALDTNTLLGALRYSIELLKEAYPHLEIVVCTPTYRFWMDGEGGYLYDSDSHELGGHKLTDYVQALKKVSSDYALFCIDNYSGSGICYDNREEYFSKKDGTHPNENGRQLIAKYMAEELYSQFRAG